MINPMSFKRELSVCCVVNWLNMWLLIYPKNILI